MAPSDRVRDAGRVGAEDTVGDVAQIARRAGSDARKRVVRQHARRWLVGDAAWAGPTEPRARDHLLLEYIDEQVAARVGAIPREVLGHGEGVKPPVVPVGAVPAKCADPTATHPADLQARCQRPLLDQAQPPRQTTGRIGRPGRDPDGADGHAGLDRARCASATRIASIRTRGITEIDLVLKRVATSETEAAVINARTSAMGFGRRRTCIRAA